MNHCCGVPLQFLSQTIKYHSLYSACLQKTDGSTCDSSRARDKCLLAISFRTSPLFSLDLRFQLNKASTKLATFLISLSIFQYFNRCFDALQTAIYRSKNERVFRRNINMDQSGESTRLTLFSDHTSCFGRLKGDPMEQ